MSIDVLRRRIVYQLTTPPALLYTLTRHWFLVSFCFSVGCLWVLTNTVFAPPVYEGKATLMLELQTTNVIPQGDLVPRPRTSTPREQDERFYQRVSMLKAESVLRKLVEQLLAQWKEEAEEAGADEPVRKEGLRGLLAKARRTVRAVKKQFEAAPPEDQKDEYMIQMAVEGFRATSSVVTHPEDSTVELFAYGPNREFIKLQLDNWIDAYKDRLEAIARESQTDYLEPRIQWYREKENTHRSALESFRKEHPEATKDKQSLLYTEMVGLLTVINDGKRPDPLLQASQLASPQPAPPPPPVPEDPVLVTLQSQLHDLDRELREKLLQHPPGSDIVTKLEVQKARLNDQILAKQEELSKRRAVEAQAAAARAKELVDLNKASGDLEAQRREDYEKDRKERQERLDREYRQALELHSMISRQLEELQELTDRYDQAKQTRIGYENKLREQMDNLEAQRTVEVKVRDTPEVGITPYKTSQRKEIAVGLLGGLGIGVGLALLLEVTRSKIRFKSDIANELALPVVGVFPRN